MSSPAEQVLDLDALPPAVREAFLSMQAEVIDLRAQTERQDYLIAELRHALYGKNAIEDLLERASIINYISHRHQCQSKLTNG